MGFWSDWRLQFGFVAAFFFRWLRLQNQGLRFAAPGRPGSVSFDELQLAALR
jgi:hypothetical protein